MDEVREMGSGMHYCMPTSALTEIEIERCVCVSGCALMTEFPFDVPPAGQSTEMYALIGTSHHLMYSQTLSHTHALTHTLDEEALQKAIIKYFLSSHIRFSSGSHLC